MTKKSRWLMFGFASLVALLFTKSNPTNLDVTSHFSRPITNALCSSNTSTPPSAPWCEEQLFSRETASPDICRFSLEAPESTQEKLVITRAPDKWPPIRPADPLPSTPKPNYARQPKMVASVPRTEPRPGVIPANTPNPESAVKPLAPQPVPEDPSDIMTRFLRARVPDTDGVNRILRRAFEAERKLNEEHKQRAAPLPTGTKPAAARPEREAYKRAVNELGKGIDAGYGYGYEHEPIR